MQEMESKQLKAELSLLKSQINPHFLFNTLNNLYSIAKKYGDSEAAEGLLKLSQLMRYMIYDSNAELVSLEKEIEYIEDYVELQRLRVNQHEFPKIHLETTGDFRSNFISPMMLIPFIENAFKHGSGGKDRNLIDIQIRLEKKVLKLKVMNPMGDNHNTTGSNKIGSGIGLENVSRRLNLIYPDRHSLSIKSDNDCFRIELIIDL